jgi:hypothetical protein
LLPNDIEFILQNTARSFPVGTTDSAADCTAALCGAGLLDLHGALAPPSGGGGGGGLSLMAVAMLAALGAPRYRLRRSFEPGNRSA